MFRILSTVLVVLTMMVDMSYCKARQCLSCDQLPKIEFPDNEVLVANSPLLYDYTLTSFFECSTNVNINPARGDTNGDGSAVVVKGSKVTIFQYIFGCDGLLEDTVCDSGEKIVWYSPASYFDENGGFLCLYACDGTVLREFICFSNNNGTSFQEARAVSLARKVPNGNLIHDAKSHCPPLKGDFY